MVLPYGERRGSARPLPRIAWPSPVRVDPLSGVAGGALLVVAVLPALVGLFDADLHRKWFAHDRSENRIAYDYAYNILAGLDEDASSSPTATTTRSPSGICRRSSTSAAM